MKVVVFECWGFVFERKLKMSEVQDSLEIKFRLIDGSDIGPTSFPAAATVSALKESIISQWPKDKENAPKTVKDLKIISAGKILENSKTVGECRSALCDVPGVITTMHVIVTQPPQEKATRDPGSNCFQIKIVGVGVQLMNGWTKKILNKKEWKSLEETCTIQRFSPTDDDMATDGLESHKRPTARLVHGWFSRGMSVQTGCGLGCSPVVNRWTRSFVYA
ncbi:hypothetical protein M8C21_000876, partial [Ambrosia artemisiifolia]